MISKDIKLFRLVILSLFVSSFATLFVFLGDYDGNVLNVVFAYLTGILFWIGFLVAYILLWIINKHRKNTQKNKKEIRTNVPGALCFFSNRYAFCADICFIISLFVLVTIFIFYSDSNAVGIVLPVLLFSVHMHGILNGVNFTYIKSLFKSSGEMSR